MPYRKFSLINWLLETFFSICPDRRLGSKWKHEKEIKEFPIGNFEAIMVKGERCFKCGKIFAIHEMLD